jgi:menaquinone-dependent protoporphyrinogen oxidase
MARVLIVYGTTEGHTAEIAERMAAAMRSAGHMVELRDSKTVRKETIGGDFDGIVVGGSVHAGDFQSSLKEFVKRNLEGLERTPSAFLYVSQ